MTDQLVGRKVLLVEDSKTYVAALAVRLDTHYGIEVVACSSMDDLRRTLAYGCSDYSVAIADLNQPGGPHGEALDLLIAHDVPPIVFTGSFDEATRNEMLAKQIADYVLKDGPSALDNVISSVVRLMSNREVRVLVVDDMRSTRELLARHLKKQLFRITKATSAEMALKELSLRPDIELAVVDYEMPGMNGVEFVRNVRRNSAYDGIRIIGVSSAERSDLMMEYLKAGANDYVRRPFDDEEFRLRVAQNVATLFHVRQLRDKAARDYLTGLYNRRHFFEVGPRLVAAGHDPEESVPMSMAVMDIDNFKLLNDTYGHEIGDEVLKEVSNRLMDACGEKHLLARLGGEEFGVLVRGLDPMGARAFCEELRRCISRESILTDDGPLNVTVSIGLAEVAEMEAFDNYLNAADQLLYMAKDAGRNRVVAERDLNHHEDVA
ncbi:diguanylate cyclase [Pseudohoeflea suaedae]|uniref:diguanylate cyclase n=1 Tax=Pseudohoeflea suaedae TaxID=877384 RepID=UPI001FCEFBF0|nr:diguanylate cyclase [Pseudohoeflea suaedae]